MKSFGTNIKQKYDVDNIIADVINRILTGTNDQHNNSTCMYLFYANDLFATD